MLITPEMVMSWNPCDDWTLRRVKWILGDGKDAHHILSMKMLKPLDKLWVVFRPSLISDIFTTVIDLSEYSLHRVTQKDIRLQVDQVVKIYRKFLTNDVSIPSFQDSITLIRDIRKDAEASARRGNLSWGVVDSVAAVENAGYAIRHPLCVATYGYKTILYTIRGDKDAKAVTAIVRSKVA